MTEKEKILITSALLYANGPVHFGHIAGAYLPADIYARFKRLTGCDVFFVSGSDEYGVAITLSAELASREPQEHIDLFHKINTDLLKRVGISFDHFSRTTNRKHKPLVQEIFTNLNNNGFIEKKETKQLYSEQEDRFLADRYVVGECPKCGYNKARGDECPKCGGSFEAMDLKHPRSKLTGNTLKLKKTTHWFFQLEKFKKELLKWHAGKNWKESVLNFVKPYVNDLHARGITRDFSWGVPVPLDEASEKVFYVWFDAVIGYISASQEWADLIGEPEKWKDYWLDPETKYVQFIGKDNITFHAIFFPAMIMGQDVPYKQVDELPANEFLNLEGKQFSKSSGWYIDLDDFLQKYPADTIRYALAANAPETSDSEFTWNDFQMRVNSELVGKFGNFIHRTLTFLTNQMDGKIPECSSFFDEDNEFLEKISQLTGEAYNAFNSFKCRKAVMILMEMAAVSNAYFDLKKPWALVKEKEETDALHTTMYCCLTAAKMLAVVSHSIIPDTADKIWKMLGNTTTLASKNWKSFVEEELVPGTSIPHPKVLFSRIEDTTIEKEIAKLEATEGAIKPNDLKDQIKFDDFTKVDLRVGKIEASEKVKGSKKLFKLIVNIGCEKRVIVSGIAEHFEDPESLIGSRVIVVANLKPAKLMGIESQGMILAAADGSFLELPVVKDAPEGTRIS